ncbi:MAG TPA: hypothetical protein VKP10_13100 [Gemmatimonadales bacterium]|nr:hypothetical protein [Gemmatimonadales bacterium]
MRSKLPFVVLAALACDSSPTLVKDLGTWSAVYSIPGPSTLVTLHEFGSVLTGDGRYAVEAGPTGTLQVTGTVHFPGITMVLHRDTGLSQTFTGAFLNDRTLSGTLADTVNGVPHESPLTFNRLASDPP